MASKKNNNFSGLIGTVVVYELNGKPVMRSRPCEYDQTKGTVAAQKIFGNASRLSASVRRSLQLLPDPKEPAMRYRFNKAWQRWLNPGNSSHSTGFSFMEHFQFNEKALMPEKLNVQLSISWDQPGKILVSLPAIIPSRDIAAPAYTETVHWCLQGIGCDIKAYRARVANPPVIADMKYTDKVQAAREIELPWKQKKDEMVLLILGLRYTVNKNEEKNMVEDLQWRPVEILGSYYKG